MTVKLHNKGVRASLPARREPYWGPPFETGRYLGYRKLEDGGTWIARLRDDDGKQHYKSLGVLEYDDAKAQAAEWFKAFDRGVTGEATVESACKEYVTDLENDGRTKAAHGTKKRFDRYVYGKPFGKTRLDKLRTSQLKSWRVEVGGSKSNQNRYMNSLKAALNLAVRNRRVSEAVAIEWRSIQQHKAADGRREIYLDLEQRRNLIAACKGPLKALVEAAALTGARPGELVALKRKDFDARTQTIKFHGKTGTRTVPLSPAAVGLFERLARSKLPNAALIDRGDGEPFDRWAYEVKDAAAEAGLPKAVSLYVLRHSWITEALRSGMATLDVARLTGTSLPMIEKNYGHLVADSARERLAMVVMV